MSLFIYPAGMADRLLLAIGDARKCPGVKVLPVSSEGVRMVVRTMSYHDLLLVPGLEHTTPEIDRVKAIAHYLGIEVRPLIVHVDKVLHVKEGQAQKQKAIRTAGMGAASPTQRIVPVVHPTV